MTRIRSLAETDIPSGLRLTQAAGWNQTASDWRTLLRLAPDTCFALQCEGQLAATATAVCYGSALAWIGMVLTDPDYRRRGFARRLLEHALQALAAQRIACIKLDATAMGAPLYRQVGFEDECPIERWARLPDPAAAPRHLSYAPCETLDAAAFGADRSHLLALLAAQEAASIGHEAYAMGRPGTQAAYFGPCVSRSPHAAGALLHWFLARHASEPVYWDLLPGNAAARELALANGFQPLRRLVRMARPGAGHSSSLVHDDSLVFAIAGFEFG